MFVSTLDLLAAVTIPVVGLTASIPDLLRLAVLPVFGWAAYRDIETRRVPTRTWYPLAVLGLLILVWEGYDAYVADDRLFFLQVAISVGFIIPLVTAFWYMGSFGGADTKAFYVIALLFPVFPTYYFPGIALPVTQTTVGVFSLTILSNTVVAGALYPLGVALTNLARGRLDWPMLIGRPIRSEDVPEEYGMLVETPDGFTTRGLDLDALRMYLRWRKCTLAELRAEPEQFRDPASLPAVAGEVGDGNIVTDGGSEDARSESSERRAGAKRHASSADERSESADSASGEGRPASNEATVTQQSAAETVDGVDEIDDRWGAEAFLDDMATGVYGTSAEDLRDGLDVLAAQDEVWISPGIPFIVPMFFGILVSLIYGDVLVSLLTALGLG